MKTKVIRYTFGRDGRAKLYKNKKTRLTASSIAELLRRVALAGGKV